jgi:hypothetical protein
VSADDRPRNDELLEQVLRSRDRHCGARHNDPDHKRMCELSAQREPLLNRNAMKKRGRMPRLQEE